MPQGNYVAAGILLASMGVVGWMVGNVVRYGGEEIPPLVPRDPGTGEALVTFALGTTMAGLSIAYGVKFAEEIWRTGKIPEELR